MDKLEALFVDMKHKEKWDDTKDEILRGAGFKMVFVPDPTNTFSSLPINSLLLPGDVITRCLLKAVMSHTAAKNTFGNLLIKEIVITNTKG